MLSEIERQLKLLVLREELDSLKVVYHRNPNGKLFVGGKEIKKRESSLRGGIVMFPSYLEAKYEIDLQQIAQYDTLPKDQLSFYFAIYYPQTGHERMEWRKELGIELN